MEVELVLPLPSRIAEQPRPPVRVWWPDEWGLPGVGHMVEVGDEVLHVESVIRAPAPIPITDQSERAVLRVHLTRWPS